MFVPFVNQSAIFLKHLFIIYSTELKSPTEYGNDAKNKSVLKGGWGGDGYLIISVARFIKKFPLSNLRAANSCANVGKLRLGVQKKP